MHCVCEAAVLSLCQCSYGYVGLWCVVKLVCCCVGCGKTALTAELARLTGNLDLVRVHVDDQMDSKSLLGAYVCTSNPEEFVWQPGPLTQVWYSSDQLSNVQPILHDCCHAGQALYVSF